MKLWNEMTQDELTAHNLKGMHEQTNCVICERRLPLPRDHYDTCGERCFRKLLQFQRETMNYLRWVSRL